eukprot:11685352-Ditylum_brightwellii.AAC.1
MKDNNLYPLQRIYDEHIMTRIIKSGKFKAKEIQHINYCQVYLNVTMIADVTLANGKHLDPHMRLIRPNQDRQAGIPGRKQ